MSDSRCHTRSTNLHANCRHVVRNRLLIIFNIRGLAPKVGRDAASDVVADAGGDGTGYPTTVEAIPAIHAVDGLAWVQEGGMARVRGNDGTGLQ